MDAQTLDVGDFVTACIGGKNVIIEVRGVFTKRSGLYQYACEDNHGDIHVLSGMDLTPYARVVSS